MRVQKRTISNFQPRNQFFLAKVTLPSIDSFAERLSNKLFGNNLRKNQIIQLFSARKNEQEQMIDFFEKLSHLKTLGVKGIERAFEKAYRKKTAEYKEFCGVYSEIIVAHNLSTNGFKIKEIAVTNIDGKNLETKTRDLNGRTSFVKRDIDIIAEKNGKTYYIEVKRSFRAFIKSNLGLVGLTNRDSRDMPSRLSLQFMDKIQVAAQLELINNLLNENIESVVAFHIMPTREEAQRLEKFKSVLSDLYSVEVMFWNINGKAFQ